MRECGAAACCELNAFARLQALDSYRPNLRCSRGSNWRNTAAAPIRESEAQSVWKLITLAALGMAMRLLIGCADFTVSKLDLADAKV